MDLNSKPVKVNSNFYKVARRVSNAWQDHSTIDYCSARNTTTANNAAVASSESTSTLVISRISFANGCAAFEPRISPFVRLAAAGTKAWFVIRYRLKNAVNRWGICLLAAAALVYLPVGYWRADTWSAAAVESRNRHAKTNSGAQWPTVDLRASASCQQLMPQATWTTNGIPSSTSKWSPYSDLRTQLCYLLVSLAALLVAAATLYEQLFTSVVAGAGVGGWLGCARWSCCFRRLRIAAAGSRGEPACKRGLTRLGVALVALGLEEVGSILLLRLGRKASARAALLFFTRMAKKVWLTLRVKTISDQFVWLEM